MYLHCAIYGGRMFSWDTNASKGSFLKSVISESIDKVLKTNFNLEKNWDGPLQNNPNVFTTFQTFEAFGKSKPDKKRTLSTKY